MKILITSDWPVHAVNGVATSIRNLYQELKSMGQDVKVLSLSEDSNYHKDGDFYYIKSFNLDLYPKLRATRHFHSKYVNELIEWKPDLVHSQCEFFSYSIASIIARKCSAPIVHTYHTMYEHYIEYFIKNTNLSLNLLKLFLEWRLADADYLITPSYKTYKEIEKIASSQVSIVPTGIDLSLYNKQVDQKILEGIKDKHRIARNKKIILYLGRISHEKNLEEAIYYFINLLRFRKDLVFLLVGGGPDLARLQNFVVREGLENYIKFIGLVPPEETVYYYRLADIFVSASTSETQGLTYIEALANSLPCVCRNDSVLKGVIDKGVNGFTYDNFEDYANAINALIDDQKLAKYIGYKARISCEKFSLDNFGENVLEVYEKTLREYNPKYKRMHPSFYRLLKSRRIIS